MSISEGDTVPDATLVRMGTDGPEQVALSSLTLGRKVAIFGVPGAFTGVCTTAHVPSFIRTRGRFAEQGVEQVICISVNDPFVLKAWAVETGAEVGGIVMLGDPESEFTKSIGMAFSAPPAGLIDRSRRYSMIVDDGRVAVLRAEDHPGVCDISGGESILAAL